MISFHGVAAILENQHRLVETIPPSVGLVKNRLHNHIGSSGIVVPGVVAIESNDVQKLCHFAVVCAHICGSSQRTSLCNSSCIVCQCAAIIKNLNNRIMSIYRNLKPTQSNPRRISS